MAFYAPGSDEARRQREARDAGLRTNTGLRPGGSQGGAMVTFGGAANDPRWRENGGSWGYRTREAAAGAGGGSNMSAYSQQAFGMPQAGHERTANQRRADRSAAFTRMHGGSQQAAPMEAYRPQQSAPQSAAPAFTPGRAQSVQAPSQGTPYTPPTPQRGGPPQHRDFARSGDFGAQVITEWVNPQTGERFTASDGTYQPRPGSGWVEARSGSGGGYGDPDSGREAYARTGIWNNPEDGRAYRDAGDANPGGHSMAVMVPADDPMFNNIPPQGDPMRFGPGRAQSIQPQSQGTPYTPPAANSMILGRPNSARSAGPVAPSQPNTPRPFGPPTSGGQQAPTPFGGHGGEQPAPRPSNSAFADAWNFSMEGNASRMAPARTFGGGGAGNMAYMPDNARPAPFTSYAIGPDGRQVSQQQSLNNRDALISALIQDNAQHAGRSGVYQGRGNPPPEFMAPPPPPNIPALWGQAQNAVSNGWVSPAAGLWG